MPTGTRIRANNVYGVTTDNPLTAASTTFNSASLPRLPPVAAAHAIVTLDPIRQFGEPEIVIVTVHTAASTVATITRGAYGTIARIHPQNTVWVHAALDEDFIEILTSATRPSDPYEGQFIFETDTNKLVGHGGVDWAPRDAGGQIGYAQTVVTQTGITAATDLTGLSVAVTVGTGRRIKVSSFVALQQLTNTSLAILRIQEGATILERDPLSVAPSVFFSLKPFIVLSPTAGVHTYKLTLESSAASVGTISATDTPSFILVEDIGAV